MPRIELGGTNGWHPEEVAIFGRLYHTRRVTRSVFKQMDALDKQLDSSATEDEAFDAFAALMDLLLEPVVEDPEPGKRKRKPQTAGALFREMWQNDQLYLDQIRSFVAQVQEAASSPPTQTPS